MDELDRFLESKYTDPGFRRYKLEHRQLTRAEGRLRRFLAWVVTKASKKRFPKNETVSLAPSRLWNRTIRQPAPILACLEGSLWLTRTGDPADYVLGPGDSRWLKPGRWVIQALESARFRICAPPYSKEVPYGKEALLPVLQRV